MNAALTELFAFSKTEHVALVPKQPPLHPANEYVLAGAAVRVICVPASKFALQTCGQLIPAGALVTVPDPVSFSVN